MVNLHLNVLYKGFLSGVFKGTAYRKVMTLDSVNVAPFKKFLNSPSSEIRDRSLILMARFGDIDIVAEHLHDHVKATGYSTVIEEVLKNVAERADGVRAMGFLLRVDNPYLVERTIEMFHKVGDTNAIFPVLLTSNDERILRKVSRYLDE